MKPIFLLGLVISFASTAYAQSRAPSDSAPRSDLREITAIVRDVELHIRNGKLRARDSSGYCEFSGDTIYMRYYSDSSGATRRAVVRWSIRHYGQTVAYTYDAQTRLRHASERRIGPDSSEASLESFWRADGTLALFDSRVLRIRMYPWSQTDPLFNPRLAAALFCSGD